MPFECTGDVRAGDVRASVSAILPLLSAACSLTTATTSVSTERLRSGPRLQMKSCVTDSQDTRASSSRAATPQLKVPLPATDVKLISSLQSPTKEPNPQKPRCIFTRPGSNRLSPVTPCPWPCRHALSGRLCPAVCLRGSHLSCHCPPTWLDQSSGD